MRHTLIILMFLLISPCAFAQTPEVPKAPAPVSRFTVSISPIHLALPMGEVMAEYNVNGKLGLAGILGAGSMTVEDSLGTEVKGTIFEVGAQGNYYLNVGWTF